MARRLPYPGLRSFRRTEADLFFGREDEEETMVQRLMGSRFLGVLGASGCGKSSLVRTALFEALDGGYSRAGSNWRIAECRPGAAPFRNLARALARVRPKGEYADSVAYIDRELRRGPRSIAQWCNENNLGPDEKLLIFVDQFEELFTTATDTAPEEVDRFATVLVEASRAADARIYVVVTMRSDYFGACGAHPGLAEKIGEGIFLTPRMQRGQCAEAIVGPADVIGFDIRDGLLNRILNDMNRFADWEGGPLKGEAQAGRQADQLPLMQYALNQMWLRAQKAKGRIELTLKQYEEVGGLEGALDQQGDELIAGLARDGIGECAVESVFRALVRGPSIDLAVRDTRPIASIAAIAGVPEAEVKRIVHLFAAQDCLFLSHDGSDDGDVSLSHESLIRRWKKLRAWFVAEAEAAETLKELARATREWQQRGEESSDLLDGRRLERRQLFWAPLRDNAAWIARHRRADDPEAAEITRFLETSVAKDRRKRRQRRTLFAGFAAGVILVPVTLAYANIISERAAVISRKAAVDAAFGKAAADRARAEATNAKARAELAIAENARSEALRQVREAATAREAQLRLAAQRAQAAAQAATLLREREAAVASEVEALEKVKAELYKQLESGDVSVTASQASQAGTVRSAFSIASILKNDEEIAELTSIMSAMSPDYVQDSIGLKYDADDAADGLDAFAVHKEDRDPESQEMVALFEDYRSTRADELRGSTPKALLAAKYEQLLARVEASDADMVSIVTQRLHLRLAMLALARRDVVAATEHLRACAKENIDDSVTMRCLLFLASTGEGAREESIFNEAEIMDNLYKQGRKKPADLKANVRDFTATVYAIAAARASRRGDEKQLTPLDEFNELANVYLITNDGNERAIDLNAVLAEARQGPGEAGFRIRRKILDAMSTKEYEPTLDFLLASEPSLLAVADESGEDPPEPSESRSPTPDIRLRPLPTREDFLASANRITADAALLNGLAKLAENQSEGTTPALNSSAAATAADRVARKMKASVTEFSRQFDRYAGFLETALGFSIAGEPHAFSTAEHQQFDMLQEAIQPVADVCRSSGVEGRVEICRLVAAKIAALRAVVGDQPLFMETDLFLGQDPVEALRSRTAPTRGLADIVGEDPFDTVYFVSAKNKQDYEAAREQYRPELNGLAIDWLAVGQKWPGRIENYCQDGGKIYVRAFPSGRRGDRCGGDLKGVLSLMPASITQPTEPGAKIEPEISFTSPVDGPSLPMTLDNLATTRVDAGVGSAVVSPAPGRIAYVVRYEDRALEAPPCRTPDKRPELSRDARSNTFQLGGRPVTVQTVVCHADGSYSAFDGVQFDAGLALGDWVRARQPIGRVAALAGAKPGTGRAVSWYVYSDGLYNWDNRLKNRLELGFGNSQQSKR